MQPHLLQNLLHFGRLLRRLGFQSSPERIRTLAEALLLVDLGRREEVRDTARALLVDRREQIPLFDRAFDHFFRPPGPRSPWDPKLGRPVERSDRRKSRRGLQPLESSAPPPEESEETWLEIERGYSAQERLHGKDFAELNEEELAQVRRLIRQGVLRLPPRRSRRRRPSRRGREVDLRRSLQRSLRQGMRHGGETLELLHRQRKVKARPLVVLADLSGSMEPYARILLELLYVLRGASDRVESFVFATRLTRITRQLARRNVDEALKLATARIRDWGGGTRIGEALRAFNFDWSRRVLGQGAVTLVISDGWDRGEVDLLEKEAARLARCTESLIWLNPLLGSPGYQPLTRGIQAVLPHIDHFLPVHNLRSLDQLGQLLAGLKTGSS